MKTRQMKNVNCVRLFSGHIDVTGVGFTMETDFTVVLLMQ